MKLIPGQKYNTPEGRLTYVGFFDVGHSFICWKCNKARRKVHEFCENWEQYQRGYVGLWVHWGSECIKSLGITVAQNDKELCEI